MNAKRIINEIIAFAHKVLVNPYFWILVILLLAIYLVVLAFRYYKKRKSYLLTTLIFEKQTPAMRRSIWRRIKTSFKQIYVPSWVSFLTIFTPFIVFFSLAHLERFDIFNSSLTFDKSNHYQNLVAILAGIGTIIFALVIFVAESLREDESKDKARVLLKVSLLYPLVLATMLGFFILVWGDVNLWATIPILGIGIFSIISLSRLISVLLNKQRFFNERLSLLKDRLRQSIDLAVNERLGINILLEKLSKDNMPITYYPLSIDDPDTYHLFTAKRSGTIVDINWKKLDEFAKEVEKQANRNGFSYYKDKVKSISEPNVSSEDLSTEAQVEKYTENQKRYLLKIYQQETKEDDALLCIDRVLVKDKQALQRLNNISAQIFIIGNKDNYSKQIRAELMSVKDQFIDAIKNENLGRISEFSDIYVNLADAFLDTLKDYDASYTSENARKERSFIGSGWNEVDWIKRDILEIFRKGMTSDNRDIIDDIIYLPILIAQRAIKSYDHYLFQEFIGFATYTYSFAVNKEDPNLKSFMIDRSWRFLKETGSYHVEYNLRKKGLSKEKKVSLKDFAVHFLVVFQDMLKEAFDNNDLESFKQFRKTVSKLFTHYHPSKDYTGSSSLKYQFDNTESLDEKEKIKEQFEVKRLSEDIEQEIASRKKQMFFGLASWIFDKLKNESANENFQEFFRAIETSLPNNIKALTEDFISASDYKVEDFWRWDWWELIPEGEVRMIDFLGKLKRLYCVKALQTLARMPESKEPLELPYSDSLASMVRSDGGLIGILDNMQENPNNWEFILSKKETEKIPTLREMLITAKRNQEESENAVVRETKISNKKIEEFKNEVVKGFKTAVTLRKVFNYYGLYEDNSSLEYRGEPNRFGVNTVDDKAVFFEEWSVHYGEWGCHYGEDIAYGEDAYMANEIAGNCNHIDILDFEDTLGKIDNLENVIIFAENVPLYKFFERSSSFTPHWQKHPNVKEIGSEEGWYTFKGHHIPVFAVHRGREDERVLILNSKRLGKFIQHSPLNKEDSELDRTGIFYMNIQAFSENGKIMTDLLTKAPEWLKQVGDAEQQKKHLQERVLIRIYERFAFEKSADFEGFLIEIEDDS